METNERTAPAELYKAPADWYTPTMVSDLDAEITIMHDHADGTVLLGSHPGDGVLEIVQRHGFTWRRYAGIHIQGSRDRFAAIEPIVRAAAALRAAGHTVAVRIDDHWRPAAVREADRGERVEARADRLAERADLAAGRSAAAREAASDLTKHRPFGQPMMPDHYSYSADRNRLERAQNLDRKSFTEADKAEHLAGRAQGAESNEAAKHNPRAIARRIERLEVDERSYARRLAENPRSRWATLRLEQLREDIAHQRAKLAAMADSGEHVAWAREHFAKGDRVRISLGRWVNVVRVNAKSLSVEVPNYYPNGSAWRTTVQYNEIHGRRRDGWQFDAPNGEAWLVTVAQQVERWQRLLQSAELPSSRYEDSTRWVRWAQRMVLGLPLDAADAEVATCQLVVNDVRERRVRTCLTVAAYDQLAAGVKPDVVRAELALPTSPVGTPEWQLPAGDPTDVRVDRLARGDLVKGFYDVGIGRRLVRSFCGPVASVSPVVDRGERGQFVTVELTTGAVREFQTHIWLAVYPAGRAGS